METKEKIINTVLEILKKEGVAQTNGSETLSIVYLDDEPEFFETFTKIFGDFGFQSFCTESIDSALEFIDHHQHEIAYIISDYKLPSQTGFDLRVKVLLIAPEIPFYILSAYITKELALEGIDLKISGFIDKPITPLKVAEIFNKDGVSRIRALKEDRELLQCFVDEASINLEQAEEIALTFDENPNDLDAVNKCFGLVHTLKGASGYFKPKTLHQFVHRFEDLLKKLQRGETALGPEVVSSILKSFDLVKVLLGEFKSRKHKEYDLEVIYQEYFEFEKQSPLNENKRAALSEFTPAQSPVKETSRETTKETSNDLKVPVKLLDSFMQTSGEMTVIRNMINKCVKSIENQFPRNKDVSMLSELLEELHKVNASVQSEILNLRKVPIHNILKPITRVIRDVSKSLGKEVEFITQGDELSVDTAIAGVLNQSLIHLVRNSLDHGLEPPEDREKNGKNRKGKVTITGTQKNDFIYIMIEDDGRGINEDSIRKKLIKNGTHTEEQAARLEKNELYSMIFEAGFSTVEKVTDISGRGVGMSMVKDSVASVGGRIDIESTPHKGSKFTLCLPVPKSVLIRDCLFVMIQGMLFGIPQDDILRVVTVSHENQSVLFRAEGALTLNDEGHLVAVVDLKSLLNLPSEQKKVGNTEDPLNLIVIKSGPLKLALNVDAILEIEDTVIKPLQGLIKRIEVYQGAAFMGDGTIGLILSAEGLLKKAGIISMNGSSHAPTNRVNSKEITSDHIPIYRTKASELLLFKLRDLSLYAIHSQTIYRIEEIHSADIRISGGAQIVPYRGKILTLLNLSDKLGPPPETQTVPVNHRLQTLVLERNNHFLGLVVDTIEEIADTDGEIIPATSQQFAFAAGNYLIGDKMVTLINLDLLLQAF